MQNEMKMSLTVLIPGTKTRSKEVSFKNPKTKNFEIKVVTENIPVKQVLKMTYEAYNYFISKVKPEGFNGSNSFWNQMSNNKKIEWHCKEIASHLNGTFESFEVFED